jgi:hypothetical protein
LPKLIGLKDATRSGLKDLLVANGFILTVINHIDIDNLSCLQMNPSTSDTLCFDLLIRGFIPSSLFSVVHSIVKTNECTQTTIANMIFIAQQIFKNEIWKDRNKAMIEFEKENGISPAEKNKPFKNATRRNLTTVNFSPPPCKRWQSWMTQNMVTGHPWLEFSHTY